MPYINFKLQDKVIRSVSFDVFSDQNRLARSGYTLLETTDAPLATGEFTYTDAAAWKKANDEIFTPVIISGGGEPAAGGGNG